MDDHRSAWVVRPEPKERARLRLFCAPHVGGGAMTFRAWTPAMPEDVELCALELPGRGRRLRETPFDQLRPLVESLVDAVLPELDQTYALFGHSFGALVAFELARKLRERGARAPALLCVSGAKAPHLLGGGTTHTLPDGALIAKVRRLGGTPEAVLENADLVAALLPAIRADFQALETYRYSGGRPLDCPILGLGGAADREVDRGSLAAWAELTTADFNLRMLPGDHFFVHRFHTQILDILGEALAPVRARSSEG